MKKIYFLLIFSLLFACQKQDDYKIDNQILEINDFVWKAMNALYLWKDQLPDLSDQRFDNQAGLNDYLQDYNDPENLFEHLKYKPGEVDRWSWIVNDYEALLKMFQGIRKTTGMHIGLVYEPGSQTNIFAYVKYVVPNSDAESKGIVRGNLFRKINGQYLTINNYQELLGQDNLNIELAQWDGNTLNDTGQTIDLQKGVIAENPIYIKQVITTASHKVGYLMYNGFVSNYDTQLNDVFAYFKTEQIDRLIIDLRYNPGGSVQTLQYMASMITGQFTGQTLLKYQWHSQLNRWMQENYPHQLQRPFVSQMANGQGINHLMMDQVIFITTRNSASASETLINSLKPYIQLTQIGTETHGKYTASITMFDSPDFTGVNVNPDHKWAIQPIVLKVSNVNNVSDFINGLTPDILQAEDYFNLGQLGDMTEPLLQTSLNFIENQTLKNSCKSISLNEIYYQETLHNDDMYVNINDFNLPLN